MTETSSNRHDDPVFFFFLNFISENIKNVKKEEDIWITTLFADLLCAAMLKVNQSADTIHKLCVNPASYVTNEWPGTTLTG